MERAFQAWTAVLQMSRVGLHRCEHCAAECKHVQTVCIVVHFAPLLDVQSSHTWAVSQSQVTLLLSCICICMHAYTILQAMHTVTVVNLGGCAGLQLHCFLVLLE